MDEETLNKVRRVAMELFAGVDMEWFREILEVEGLTIEEWREFISGKDGESS